MLRVCVMKSVLAMLPGAGLVPVKTRVKAMGLARSGIFFAESLPIRWIRSAIDPKSVNSDRPADFLQNLRKVYEPLLNADAENVSAGIYPESLVWPKETVGEHLDRYYRVVRDSIHVAFRSRRKNAKHFSPPAKAHLKDLPSYYRRNFHFQTDGYLSEDSADLYTHQTEILFQGSLDLMRRVLLAPLITKIKSVNETGRNCRILELGCGNGDATRILATALPEVEIFATDISPQYVAYAEKRLKDFSNIRFGTLDGAAANSANEKYDVVLSCYVMHEMPLNVRKKFFANSCALVKRKGVWFHIDSVQLDDAPEWSFALKQFPKSFHEPFYKNYISSPLKALAEELKQSSYERVAFLSKSIQNF